MSSEAKVTTTCRQQIEFELEHSLNSGYLTAREFEVLIHSLDSQQELDSIYIIDDELVTG